MISCSPAVCPAGGAKVNLNTNNMGVISLNPLSACGLYSEAQMNNDENKILSFLLN